MLLNATSAAPYSWSPCAKSFQTMTIAMQRASPIMIRPTMYSGLSRQQQDREKKHQHRPDQPILHQGNTEDFRVAKDQRQLFVLNFRQRRIHHQYQSDRYRQVCRSDLKSADEPHRLRNKIAKTDTESHRDEYPDRQISVEEGHSPQWSVIFYRHILIKLSSPCNCPCLSHVLSISNSNHWTTADQSIACLSRLHTCCVDGSFPLVCSFVLLVASYPRSNNTALAPIRSCPRYW